MPDQLLQLLIAMLQGRFYLQQCCHSEVTIRNNQGALVDGNENITSRKILT